jgi:hypothetical protein
VKLDDEVTFAPETVVEEVLQNVRTILNTRIGTVPLDRAFGISWEAIDKPLPLARAMTKVEIIEAIQKFEPRANVESVEFDDGADSVADGLMKPIVTIKLEDEENE